MRPARLWILCTQDGTPLVQRLDFAFPSEPQARAAPPPDVLALCFSKATRTRHRTPSAGTAAAQSRSNCASIVLRLRQLRVNCVDTMAAQSIRLHQLRRLRQIARHVMSTPWRRNRSQATRMDQYLFLDSMLVAPVNPFVNGSGSWCTRRACHAEKNESKRFLGARSKLLLGGPTFRIALAAATKQSLTLGPPHWSCGLAPSNTLGLRIHSQEYFEPADSFSV